MRVFVAGAGGYLGLALCDELVRRGHQVTAFDLWLFGKEPPSDCLKMKGDIRDIGPFGSATDCIVDLAGLSNDAVGDMDPELTRDINVRGAQRLALAAKRAGIKQYIYSSSASVYGANTAPNLTEDDDCKPLTAYAESKVRMEDFLRKETDKGFNPAIFRNATVFGVSPRMRFDLVVNGMTRSAYLDGTVTIDGTGEQWRPFVHIDDVVQEFADRIENYEGPQTRNIVAHNSTIRAVSSVVAGYFGDHVKLKHNVATDKRSYHLKETIWGKFLSDGVRDVAEAMRDGIIDSSDPTAWTVKWYRENCDLRVMA